MFLFFTPRGSIDRGKGLPIITIIIIIIIIIMNIIMTTTHW